MASSTLSFRVDDQIIDALDMAAEQTRAGRSKIAREALLLGLEELRDAEGDVQVPEHVAHDAKIKRLIARKKRTRRAGKFRSEFSKQLKRSFENNEHPEEFRRSVSGYIEEAEDMGELPPEVAEETGCATFEAWVHDKIDYYRAAYQASTFDADPIENPLKDYEGVADAREWMDRAEAIAQPNADKKGGPSAEEKRKEAARYAIQDGVVPETVLEEAQQSDRPPKEVVASAAVDLCGSNSQPIESNDSDTEALDR